MAKVWLYFLRKNNLHMKTTTIKLRNNINHYKYNKTINNNTNKIIIYKIIMYKITTEQNEKLTNII